MTELQASRTLLKSPPELWAECSDAASLARHLGRFGEIRITRLDPETAVAWEGEHARGTVRIEPAGWGTKVVLTATAVTQPVEEAIADAPVDELALADVPAEEPLTADIAVDEPALADVPAEEPLTADIAVEEPPAGAPAEEPLTPDIAVEEPPADAPAEQPPAADAPVAPSASVPSPPRRGRFARLLAFLRGPERQPEILPMNPAQPGPEAVAPPEPEIVEPVAEREVVEPVAECVVIGPVAVESAPPPPAAPSDTEAALAAALDSLGQAHHRPYSRA